MFENTKIKELALAIMEENINLKESVEELMTKWEAISKCGEKIFSKTPFTFSKDGNNYELYLCTGESQLKDKYGNNLSNSKPFWEILEPKQLREFVYAFPQMVENIAKVMSNVVYDTKRTIDYTTDLLLFMDNNQQK